MPLTTTLKNKLLDAYLGGVSYTGPATVYFGLSTTTPASDGTGVTEPSGNGYARVSMTNNTTNFPSASGASKANGAPVNFPQATGSWGTVTYLVIYDQLTAGTLQEYVSLGASSKSISSGDTPSFANGQFTLGLS